MVSTGVVGAIISTNVSGKVIVITGAECGHTQARARKLKIRILRWPYHDNDRAQAEAVCKQLQRNDIACMARARTTGSVIDFATRKVEATWPVPGGGGYAIGHVLDGVVEYLADSGTVRALLEAIPEGSAREAALADVRESLVAYHRDAGVRLGGGIWIITATRLNLGVATLTSIPTAVIPEA